MAALHLASPSFLGAYLIDPVDSDDARDPSAAEALRGLNRSVGISGEERGGRLGQVHAGRADSERARPAVKIPPGRLTGAPPCLAGGLPRVAAP
jgi:hypothetical protein